MPAKVAEYVVDFKKRRFQLKKADTGEAILRFSRKYLDLLLRECGRMWLRKAPCPTRDYILKEHSLSEDEWEVKLTEIGRVPEKYRQLVRHPGDWINRYEFHFCREFYDRLSA